jgi:hypothetical protein
MRSAVSVKSIALHAGRRYPRASLTGAWPIGIWICTDHFWAEIFLGHCHVNRHQDTGGTAGTPKLPGDRAVVPDARMSFVSRSRTGLRLRCFIRRPETVSRRGRLQKGPATVGLCVIPSFEISNRSRVTLVTTPTSPDSNCRRAVRHPTTVASIGLVSFRRVPCAVALTAH